MGLDLIKGAKNIQENESTTLFELFYKKNRFEKHLIEKWSFKTDKNGHFTKTVINGICSKMAYFGAGFSSVKNIQKMSLEPLSNSFVQKRLKKKTNIQKRQNFKRK